MHNRKIFRAAAWSLAFGLAALSGATAARAQAGDEKKIEKRKIVFIDKDGKRQVFEGDGLLMKRGYLGVGLTDLTPELRTHFGAPEDAGVMVSKVEPGSPAEKSGVKVGDILTSVDGKEVKSSWDVMAKVRGLDDGQQVPLEVWRDGKVQTLTAAVVERERTELDMGPLLWKSNGGEPLMLRLPRGEELKGLEQFKLPTSPREIELEKKLKDLEKRLDELEKRLAKQKG
jgi:membrane-associated protease RseP (regulator of RpoE activity)